MIDASLLDSRRRWGPVDAETLGEALGRLARYGPTRVGLALAGAGLVTWALLASMQFLVDSANQRLGGTELGALLDFVRVEREEQVRTREPKPERPPEPQPAPNRPTVPRMANVQPRFEPVEVEPVSVDANIDLSAEGFSLDVGGGDYLPIVKVAPVYPQRALLRGIEGYVILEFTVTAQGTVEDIRVVESEPANRIFHEAAIDAARQFKYTPRTVSGAPVATPGVRHKFTFTIRDDA